MLMAYPRLLLSQVISRDVERRSENIGSRVRNFLEHQIGLGQAQEYVLDHITGSFRTPNDAPDQSRDGFRVGDDEPGKAPSFGLSGVGSILGSCKQSTRR